jgi:hypothetical protein
LAKHAVLTMSTGVIGELSHPTIEAYAKKLGADFIVLEEKLGVPDFEKFQIYDLLLKYDRIVFLDNRLLVRDDCPDLFELVPKEQLGLFNECSWTGDHSQEIRWAMNEFNTGSLEWEGRYFNTCVMVVSRCHRRLFKKPETLENERAYLNVMILKEKLDVYELTYKHNRLACMDQFTGEDRRASFIVNYTSAPQEDLAIEVMKTDLENWADNAPEYKYKRHVLIDVQGGLGDQVDAEPAIRFLLKNVYPGEDVRVITHFPRIFQHLSHQIPVALHGEMEKDFDGGFYHICTLPGPETSMWAHVSYNLCHTVDYAAMACMRRILPEDEKQIRLEVNYEELSSVMDTLKTLNLKDFVLVHPGKHWSSKTFPTEYWQEVIDELQAAGEKVVIIGKDLGGNGVLDVIAREGMIDTRDLLELGELIALISQAKVVISNDSAPVHIAGAFDNWIILIPTCKHPDHVFPWRNGVKTYKTKALHKRLVIDDIDSAPTQVHGQTAEFLPRDIYEYLPDVEDIVEAVKEINCSLQS